MAHEHHPLPPGLRPELEKLAELLGTETTATNAVYVMSQVLGKAYLEGHRDGYSASQAQRWAEQELTARLEARLDKNKEKS